MATNMRRLPIRTQDACSMLRETLLRTIREVRWVTQGMPNNVAAGKIEHILLTPLQIALSNLQQLKGEGDGD